MFIRSFRHIAKSSSAAERKRALRAQVTYKSYVLITLVFGSSLWDTLYYLRTALLQVYKKNVLLIKSDIRHFSLRSNYVWKLRYNYVASCFGQYSVSFSTSELRYKCFCYNGIFLGLRLFVVRLHYVWNWL